MPAKHSRHIALTKPLAAYVDEQIARGEYQSVSDLVRTAIRLLQAQNEAPIARQAARTAQSATIKGRA